MRRLIIPFLLLALCQLSVQGQQNHRMEVAKNLDIFNQIYKNLELLYVDTLNAQETIGAGITAMLRSLDPYTEYYPESKDLKSFITGKYA